MAEKELIKPTEKEEVEIATKELGKPDQSSVKNLGSNSLPIQQNSSASPVLKPLDLAPFPTSNEMSSPGARTIQAFKAAKVDPIERINAEFEKLSELEKDILKIARSILKQKRYKAEMQADRVEQMSPLMEKLYSKCIGKLTHVNDYSKDDIFQTIHGLIEKQWIVTDQRRTRREILETETLQAVLSFIHDYPGTHARDDRIETEIGITRNPFIKHVMVLEAFGLVRSKKIGRTLNYFISNIPEIFDEFVVLFSNPLVVDIIKILLQENNVGLSEIARRLGVYHGAIQYHIKNLVEKDIIIKNGNDMQINRTLLASYNDLYKIPPFKEYM